MLLGKKFLMFIRALPKEISFPSRIHLFFGHGRGPRKLIHVGLGRGHPRAQQEWAHMGQCGRIFNAFGTRVKTTGAYGAVFGVFLKQKLADKPLTLVGNGNQKRDGISIAYNFFVFI